MLASSPSNYYRLDDLSTAMTDSSGAGRNGTYTPGIGTTDHFDQPGAPVGDGDRAVSLDGSSSYLVRDDQSSGPQTFSVEIWFRTTTTLGGELIGFGNSQTGLSTAYDRLVYLRDDGRLTFEVAVYPDALSAARVTAHYQAAQSGTYRATVLADDPDSYWRLDETGPPVAPDSSGHGVTATYRLGPPVRLGAPGALVGGQSGSTAAVPDGISGAGHAQTAVTAPATFTVEVWFRTSTPRGGMLVGFGDAPTGTSTNRDRLVYLTDTGSLVFGVLTGGVASTISTPAGHADGAWHLVTASVGPAGMLLYVDGTRLATAAGVTVADASYTGYWRIGGDSLAGWPARPGSDYYAGSLDEVAVYPAQLSDLTVSVHYHANRA